MVSPPFPALNFFTFLTQSITALLHPGPGPIRRRYQLRSRHLRRKVGLVVYRPLVFPHQKMFLCLFNDGQDLLRMDTQNQLGELFESNKIPATLTVGVVAGDRMREYGTSERPDYLNRGDLARAYELFITQELMPWLEQRYTLWESPRCRSVAGFSLGGLNAFDLAWRNPNHFGGCGVFSGALWWRSTSFDPDDPDAGRIVHDYVEAAQAPPPGFRAWMMAGTEDEKEDRNNNGIIDAIDDTLQLMDLLRDQGLADEDELAYFEVQNGRHNPDTWKTVLKDYLMWITRLLPNTTKSDSIAEN